MAIHLNTSNIDPKIIDLIYDKQTEFKKEKKRHVSLEYTVCRLLRDKYLVADGKDLRQPGEQLTDSEIGIPAGE